MLGDDWYKWGDWGIDLSEEQEPPTEATPLTPHTENQHKAE